VGSSRWEPSLFALFFFLSLLSLPSLVHYFLSSLFNPFLSCAFLDGLPTSLVALVSLSTLRISSTVPVTFSRCIRLRHKGMRGALHEILRSFSSNLYAHFLHSQSLCDLSCSHVSARVSAMGQVRLQAGRGLPSLACTTSAPQRKHSPKDL
jgi:hypothetical protein